MDWLKVVAFLSLYCQGCLATGRYTLQLIFSLLLNNERKTDTYKEPVYDFFASSWSEKGRLVSVYTLAEKTEDGVCYFSKNMSSAPNFTLSNSLFFTFSVSDICTNVPNADVGNDSLILSNFQLRPDSHHLSQHLSRIVIKNAECCSGQIMIAALMPSTTGADLIQSTSFYGNINGQSSFASGNNSTLTFLSKNSIFFVAISFIVLMVISLGWLAFYYVERFRNAHTKQYISKRIAKAAKKALSKMPLKTVRGNGTDDANYQAEQCTVCIEQFRQNDTIRILPCKHLYHKSCIDPWILEQHTCPVCKLDILTASGIELPFGRYNCDLETALSGRSLELYPVQLDVLMQAGESASPESSASGIGGDQEIQLVHIRPPAVQVHSHPSYFRSSQSRRSSASSLTRSQTTPYSKVVDDCESSPNSEGKPALGDEDDGNDDATGNCSPCSCRSAGSCSAEEAKLLSGPSSANEKHVSSPRTNSAGTASKKSKRNKYYDETSDSNKVKCSSNNKKLLKNCSASKNVACVVDVIAPATPPLETDVANAMASSTPLTADDSNGTK